MTGPTAQPVRRGFPERFRQLANRQPEEYRLNDQIGFILRKANQRHTGIFSEIMPADLTPTRFAAMAKLLELGPLSQNELGRLTAMDIATIKGVVDRLRERGLITSRRDPQDARRQLVELTAKGLQTIQAAIPLAQDVTDRTLDTLSNSEARQLLSHLAKIS